MRCRLAVLALVGIGLTPLSCGGSDRSPRYRTAPRLPRLAPVFVNQAGCVAPAYRPARIVLACGGVQDFIDSLHWVTYGRRSALAYGVVRIDDCTPNCAGGGLSTNVAIVSLAGIVRCADGRRYYSRLGMTFTLTPPVPLGEPFLMHPCGGAGRREWRHPAGCCHHRAGARDCRGAGVLL